MMLAQAGGDAGQEAAVRRMVQGMKGLSDGQVAVLAKAAATFTGGAARLRAARAWLASQPLLVAALVVLLLALVLRWLGWA